ncbi:MAG TPA: DUF1549 domain-containing protein [Bryobacteraceae bacterium]|nr:DUF1549 domain-containing protein [Bryobacteraceae bacterium]
MCQAGLLLLLSAALAVSQTGKPRDARHPEAPVDRSKALDQFTQSVQSRLPAASAVPARLNNYIDDYIFGKMKQDSVPHAALCTDTEFLRRVSLDLTGRLPEAAAIRKFVNDADPEKREKLIDSLMETPVAGLRRRLNTPYLERWTYWFGDLFRSNDGHLNKGRELFYDYLYSALLENLPYDQMVREMLTATARSNWTNGPVNMLARDYVNETDDSIINNEDTYDQWAISSSKVFLGINVECISCHDGKGHLEKVNQWLSKKTRAAFWRQAAFFAQSRLWRPFGDYSNFALTDDGKGYDVKRKSVTRMQRYRTDVSPAFLLTGEKPEPGENPRAAYARMLTGNIQFARATVNLFWAELMGVGIVDPPFAFDLDAGLTQSTHPELLEALAKDFQSHHYDLRYLIKLITKSSTYQLSSRFDGEWKPDYARYFARHFVRRLPATQIWDAICQSTGVFLEVPILRSDRKVKYVQSMIDPDDLGQKNMKPLADLLASFGLNNRYSVGDDAGTKGSVIQASVLLNNPLVLERVKFSKGSRLFDLLQHEPPYTNAQIVEELFLATLSRFPSGREKDIGVKLLQDYHTQGAEDLLWSLINHLEFSASI